MWVCCPRVFLNDLLFHLPLSLPRSSPRHDHHPRHHHYHPSQRGLKKSDGCYGGSIVFWLLAMESHFSLSEVVCTRLEVVEVVSMLVLVEVVAWVVVDSLSLSHLVKSLSFSSPCYIQQRCISLIAIISPRALSALHSLQIMDVRMALLTVMMRNRRWWWYRVCRRF